jgi:hypothetical protein
MASATETEAFSLEAFWALLLSSDPAHIRRAWRSLLSVDEHQAVRAHLTQMAEAPGWHPAQQQAAADALRVIAGETPAPPSPAP